MKKIILPALVGAVVAFIWGMLSWMALPWHHNNFSGLTDEASVATVVKSNAPKEGIYFLPYMAPTDHGNAEKEAVWTEKATTGPFSFMVVVPNGITHKMGQMMLTQFLLVFIVAFLLTWLLSHTTVTCNKKKALLTAAAALTGALIAHGSHWNWWHFPTTYTVINIADMGIQWFLAGFAMAKVSGKMSD